MQSNAKYRSRMDAAEKRMYFAAQQVTETLESLWLEAMRVVSRYHPGAMVTCAFDDESGVPNILVDGEPMSGVTSLLTAPWEAIRRAQQLRMRWNIRVPEALTSVHFRGGQRIQ